MKKINYYLVSILSAILSACTVGPDFEKPTAPAISNYTGEENRQFSQSVPTDWWKTFQSKKLNQMIQEGVKKNYTLAAMQETLLQAQDNINAAKGQLLPQVSTSAGPGYEKYGVTAFGNTGFTVPAFHYYTLGPSINWALDLFGGTKRTIEQQQALMQYQREELRATYLTLTGNIVTTSFTLAAINEQIINLKNIITNDKQNLRLQKTGFAIGATTQQDILLAESQLRSDETQLPTLYQQLSVAQGELTTLVSAFAANWQAPHFELNDFVLPKKLPLTLPSQLIHDRPDIAGAEALLHAASAAVGIATANLYPQINLSAMLSQQALSPGQLFDPSSTAASLFAGLTAPIFSGGTLRAQKSAAEHAFKASYANYQQVVIRAFTQVSDVLHALDHDDQAVLTQQNALTSARNALQLIQNGNRIGSSNELELLQAMRFYQQAKSGYIQAIAQRYQDTAQLYLTLGGGENLKVIDNHPHID